jgi:hypothetical protein
MKHFIDNTPNKDNYNINVEKNLGYFPIDNTDDKDFDTLNDYMNGPSSYNNEKNNSLEVSMINQKNDNSIINMDGNKMNGYEMNGNKKQNCGNKNCRNKHCVKNAHRKLDNENEFSADNNKMNSTMQFYIGSLTVVGLYILFKMIQKTK